MAASDAIEIIVTGRGGSETGIVPPLRARLRLRPQLPCPLPKELVAGHGRLTAARATPLAAIAIGVVALFLARARDLTFGTIEGLFARWA